MVLFKQCITLALCFLVTNNILFAICSPNYYNIVGKIANYSNCQTLIKELPVTPYRDDTLKNIGSRPSILRHGNYHFTDETEKIMCATPVLSNGDGKHREETSLAAAMGCNLSRMGYLLLQNVDQFVEMEALINKALFGYTQEEESDESSRESNIKETQFETLAHFPSGQVMRAELFENKSGVHLPASQFMHRGHCMLNITKDHMQTAVNAFSIFLEGTVEDILNLPSLYVLRSARAISMMKVAREKLVATWKVVKGDHRADEITFQVLEMYRPLFKYINGREISKLNLSDERILSYIGTHADLDRHQVGVVASKYIKMNKHWNNVKYLNLMNNLLCGVPMLYMRTLEENTYLQLSHQIFYHIRSCDPLQRRFFLHIMTKTQVLGRSNSWSASDVARLGLLLTEVDAPELSAITPQAMSGITAQVMMEMAPQNLKFLSDSQLRYIPHKPMNILAKKLHGYQDELLILSTGFKVDSYRWILIVITLAVQLINK